MTQSSKAYELLTKTVFEELAKLEGMPIPVVFQSVGPKGETMEVNVITGIRQE